MASLYLDGIAAEWYYALERDVGHMQWLCFSDFINIQSPPPSLQRAGQAEGTTAYRYH
jgi:hypothetical protein